MADTSTTSHVFPSANDVNGSLAVGWGKTMYELNLATKWAAGSTINNFVISGGLLPASDADLQITVPACVAFLDGHYVSVDAQAVTVGASVTTHLFLKLLKDANNNVSSVAYETNTTGTAPADSVKIGTLVSDTDNITSTNQDGMPRGIPHPAKGPVAIGAGSTAAHEGSVTISASQALSGVHFYTDFTLDAGDTLTIADNAGRLLIFATGTITINGTIDGIGAGGLGGAGGSAAALGDPTGIDGGPGTSQPGGGGGSNGTSGSGGGHGGHALPARGGVGGRTGAGVSGAQGQDNTGALVGIANPLGIYGGGGGGGGGGRNSGTAGSAGGNGGASIILVAPTVVLGAAAVLNTSGANGTGNATEGGGGGGGSAGNVYIFTRSYTDKGATFTMTAGSGGVSTGTGGNGAAGRAGVKQIILY